MTPAGTTIPTTGIGVWRGAAVVVNDRLGIVVGPDRVTAYVWLAPDAIQPAAIVLQAVSSMHIDLTHRPTRLEVMARTAERAGHDPECAVFRYVEWPATGEWAYELGSPIDGQIFGTLYGPTQSRHHRWNVVPGLAALDYGSPDVDIQALAIVAEWVFGGKT